MNRKVVQTFEFILLVFVITCLASISMFAQRTGFSAAEPESLNDPTTVKCKAGNKWYIVEIPAKGFNFDSPESAQSVTEEVLRVAGYLPKSITAKEAIVGNAAICRSTENNYILYDPNWFRKLYADTNEKWADRGIFAHEIGHFEKNHHLKGLGSTPEMELEADEYAGELLAKMGASLEEALSAFNSARMRSSGGHSHPATEQRLTAVEKGWKKVDISSSIQKARVFYDFGNNYYSKNEYDKAIIEFTKAIEVNPLHSNPYYARGRAYYYKQDYDKAIADYTKAIEIDPQNASAYNNRGLAYYYKTEYDKAIADYTKAVVINPKYAGAYNNRAFVYWNMKGEGDKAVVDYSKVIEINPKDAKAYYNRGFTYYNNKREFEKAIIDFSKAIEIDPKYHGFYTFRALAYRAIGKNDLAEADIKKANALKSQ